MSMKTFRGFTLVEAMVAVTILAFAVAGPLSAASRALVAAETARDQLTASYLAQEGIEYVRAMRDDAYLNAYKNSTVNPSTYPPSGVSAAAWIDFTGGSNAWSMTGCTTASCTVDPARYMGTGSGLSLTAYSGSMPLYLASGAYTQQATGVQTPFTRTVQATVVTATDATIVSKVSWSFHGTPYTVAVTDHLTPWQ